MQLELESNTFPSIKNALPFLFLKLNYSLFLFVYKLVLSCMKSMVLVNEKRMILQNFFQNFSSI